MHHLIQRWGDQAGEADQVGLLAPGSIEDSFARNHNAEIDDLEIIALKHDTDDFFSNIVNISLHCSRNNFAVGLVFAILCLFHERHQVPNRPLHYPR